jgi:hypothetical protein
MFPFRCNIDKTDRTNRCVIGAILLIGALVGMGRVFCILAGLVLIIEGAIGWCSIPHFIEKFKEYQRNRR